MMNSLPHFSVYILSHIELHIYVHKRKEMEENTFFFW